MESLSAQIFLVFFKIGFLSFGGVFGVLPELERMVVAEHHWISSEQFVHAYVIGQFLPGPNMAMCPVIGYWVHGLPGFFAAFLGIYTPPCLMMAFGWMVYRRVRERGAVRRAERAIRPVILGLLLAAGLRLWWVQMNPESMVVRACSIALIAAFTFAYARKRLGPMLTIFAAGAIWYAFHVGRQWA